MHFGKEMGSTEDSFSNTKAKGGANSTFCTRNISPRAVQDWAAGSRHVGVNNECVFSMIFHSRASYLIRIRHCWVFHFSPTHKSLFVFFCDFTVTTHHLIPQTAGLFGRLAIQSLLAWRRWSPKHDAERIHCSAERFQGSLHLHGDVEWHRLVPKNNEEICKGNSSSVPEQAKRLSQRTLDIPRIWIWRKTVCYARTKTRWLGHQKWCYDLQVAAVWKAKVVGKHETFDNAELAIAEFAFMHRYHRQSPQHLRSRRGLVLGTSSTSRSSLSTMHQNTCCVGG